ncbi:MAG: methyl-coenzyme M reductase family protein [Candidatus Methanomethylophilaceae archaeon]|nr:methanogenesis marker 7 protein [Candidatus Methanomethylophilaceae archaeon]MDD3378625.1 methyl-coenzyme M reductase family protein [Candidatus Methanomethylophilaceae archaeon]MDY0225143.1 methyl-coenzyme M reductase family protein [Candidatus Methanomethylophilaceae archaeon]
MFDVIMYDGGVYRSEELYELIEDVGGVIIQKTRSAQMLTVTMSIPAEDRKMVEAFCIEIGGEIKPVPLAGTEIAIVGPTLGRHHMPHPICDIAEQLRRYGAVTVVMGLARGRGKLTAQINLQEKTIIDEYDAAVFSLGNFKSCIEAKTDLFKDITVPVVLVSGPMPEGIDDTCEAIVSGVGRKTSRMRTAPERAKLEEIADAVETILADRKKVLEEDPMFVHPGEIKQLLEEYEPVNMCLRPAPLTLHLDGLRVKIPYDEHHEYIENMTVYGRKLKDVCTIAPSKIDDSSILIRIKTRSEIEYEDARKVEKK